MKPFCATCLDDTMPLASRPLGRDGGTVLLCPSCDPGDGKPTKPSKRRNAYDVLRNPK